MVVDKPAGITSHDVVARCRRLFGQRRVGHAGTLDPGATGVLLVGLGSATRLLRFLSALDKSYVGEAVLGVETDTLDADGRIVATHQMVPVSLEEARRVATKFTGEIDQVPPMVSAVSVGGRRLHELARAGEVVDRPARRVTVSRFEVAPGAEPHVLAVRVTCSSGTYVRVLVADLGRALGGGAHLRNLRRTSVGPFTSGQAVTLEALAQDPLSRVIPPAEAVSHLAVVTVGQDRARAVLHGAVIEERWSGAGPWAVLDESGDLLAVYEAQGGRVKPAVVLAAGDGQGRR